MIRKQDIYSIIDSYIHEIITESGVDKNAHTNAILRKIKTDIDSIPASDKVLDKIRAEIEQLTFEYDKSIGIDDTRTDAEKSSDWWKMEKLIVLQIIDKYKAESEGKT